MASIGDNMTKSDRYGDPQDYVRLKLGKKEVESFWTIMQENTQTNSADARRSRRA